MYRIKTGFPGNRYRCSGLWHVMEAVPLLIGPGIGSKRGINPDTVECCAILKSAQVIDSQRKGPSEGSIFHLIEVGGVNRSIGQTRKRYFVKRDTADAHQQRPGGLEDDRLKLNPVN